MPRPIFRQAIAWTSGFTNYVPPVLLILIWFYLSRNILAMAGCSHKSQRIEENLLGIINSDEVFWCRRTDGISYKANINVSSGDGSKLNDFQLINLVDIDDDVPVIGDYLWTPDLLDEEKKAVFNWNEVQSISSVKIYGNIDDTSAINKLKIVFGSGQEYEVGPLPNNGEPLEMCFDKPLLTKTCMVKLLDVTGDKYGISECEFYSSLEEGSHLPPYCKMMIDDNFVYYYVTNAKRLKLSTYQYGIVGKPVYDILEGHAEVDSDGNVIKKGAEALPSNLRKKPARHGRFIIIVDRRENSLYKANKEDAF